MKMTVDQAQGVYVVDREKAEEQVRQFWEIQDATDDWDFSRLVHEDVGWPLILPATIL